MSFNKALINFEYVKIRYVHYLIYFFSFFSEKQVHVARRLQIYNLY